MTRDRLVLQVIVLLIMCAEAVAFFFTFNEPGEVHSIGLLAVVLLPIPNALWRFAHPYVPNREDLIWSTGYVVEKVDDIMAAVASLKYPVMAAWFVLQAVFGALQIAAMMALWHGQPVAGALLLVASLVPWIVSHVITTLLPRELQ